MGAIGSDVIQVKQEAQELPVLLRLDRGGGSATTPSASGGFASLAEPGSRTVFSIASFSASCKRLIVTGATRGSRHLATNKRLRRAVLPARGVAGLVSQDFHKKMKGTAALIACMATLTLNSGTGGWRAFGSNEWESHFRGVARLKRLRGDRACPEKARPSHSSRAP